MRILYVGVFLCILPVHANANCTIDKPQSGMAECIYDRFSLWMSCTKKAALLSWALIGTDTGSEDTSDRTYFLDESAKGLNCQQTSKDTYQSVYDGYDVGHLTAIDWFDNDQEQALQTNVMTNMVPQALSFNRTGAWKRTESLVECYRDEQNLAPLLVLSGPIFGDDKSNDHFSTSHGLPQTPDYLWKLIYSSKAKEYDAWIMRNANTSKVSTLSESRRKLDSLIASLANQSDQDYHPVIERLKNIKAENPSRVEFSWNNKCSDRRG